MQYNLEEFRKRIERIDGGMATVAKKCGVSKVRIHNMLKPTSNVRLKSMQKLIDAIKTAEKEQEAAKQKNPEFFLS